MLMNESLSLAIQIYVKTLKLFFMITTTAASSFAPVWDPTNFD